MCVCVYVCIEMSERFLAVIVTTSKLRPSHRQTLLTELGNRNPRLEMCVCVCVFDYVLSMVQGVLAKRCGVDWCSTWPREATDPKEFICF